MGNRDYETSLRASVTATYEVSRLESGKSRVLFWNNAAILSLALSRDGRLLACGNAAGQVWVLIWYRNAGSTMFWPLVHGDATKL